MVWVVNAMPRLLYYREEVLVTHCIGSWVDPSEDVDRRGLSHPHRDSISGPPNPQRVVMPNTLTKPTGVSRCSVYKTSLNSGIINLASLSHLDP
jgi:hypothetical protein